MGKRHILDSFHIISQSIEGVFYYFTILPLPDTNGTAILI
jgi:hypothetical protein